MSKELYTYTCPRCNKVFRTDDPDQKVCSECLEHSQPHHKTLRKNTKSKALTFAQISHISEVYNKIHHKYLHYGDVVSFISLYPNKCICCGATLKNKKHLCDKCEKAGE